MHSKRCLILVLGLLLVAAGSAVAFFPLPVGHLRVGSPGAGSFDFTGTQYEGVAGNCQGAAPPVTLWPMIYGGSTTRGRVPSNVPCYESFQNAALDLSLPGYTDAEWVLVDIDLGSMCWPFMSGGPEDFAVETSFVDSARENTPQHRSFYAIAAVRGCDRIDIGNVTNGLGAAGNRVPLQEVPVPQVLGYSYGPDEMRISVRLQDPASYTDGQADDPVAGTLLLYVHLDSGEPLTSDPAAYRPVTSDYPYDIIPKGTTDVTVGVPYPTPLTGNIYLVSVVSYYDEALRPGSAGTSGHSTAVPVGQPGQPPNLNLAKIVDPQAPAPGQTVHYMLVVENEADVDALNVRVWDNMNLGPGCLDLSSITNLRCPRCTTIDYTPATGDLLATKDTLPGANNPGNNLLMIEFDATAVSGTQVCSNTAHASASGQGTIAATAVFGPFNSPVLDLVKVVDPTQPAPGETVSYTIILENEGPGSAEDVVITDNLNLGAQCLDLNSVTNLHCPGCDTITYNPATGDLQGTKSELPGTSVPGGNVVYITFDATALSDTVNCANTSRAVASNHPEVQATAVFGPDQLQHFRRFGLTSATGNDLSWVFPLPPLMNPPPSLPWADASGVLSDPTYPLVFYQSDGVPKILLRSERSTSTVKVCAPDACQ